MKEKMFPPYQAFRSYFWEGPCNVQDTWSCRWDSCRGDTGVIWSWWKDFPTVEDLCLCMVMGLLPGNSMPALWHSKLFQKWVGEKFSKWSEKKDFSNTNLKDFLHSFRMQRNACLNILPTEATPPALAETKQPSYNVPPTVFRMKTALKPGELGLPPVTIISCGSEGEN